MRQWFREIRRPSEYAWAGIKSVRSTLERQPVVKQLGTRVEKLLRRLDRTARRQAPRTVETVAWLLRQTLHTFYIDATLPTVINATGTVFSPDATVAWSDAAMVEFCRMAGSSSGNTAGDASLGHCAIAGLLQNLVACGDACVFSHPALAASLAMEAIAGGAAGRLVIPKCHIIHYTGVALPQLAARANTALAEIGTVDECPADSFAHAINDASCPAAVLVASGHVPQLHANNWKTLYELAAIARAAHKPVLLLADHVVPVECNSPLCEHVRRLKDLMPLADMLILPGDRLLGGPRCGILVGDKELVRAAQQSPWTVANSATLSTLAALAATLKLWSTAELRTNLPIWQLLSATPDTIGSRTDRVIELCAGLSDSIRFERTSSIVRLEACASGAPNMEMPALKIIRTNHSGDQLAQQLARSQPRILSLLDKDGDGLILQLASVLPRQDAELAKTLRAVLRSI